VSSDALSCSRGFKLHVEVAFRSQDAAFKLARINIFRSTKRLGRPRSDGRPQQLTTGNTFGLDCLFLFRAKAASA